MADMAAGLQWFAANRKCHHEMVVIWNTEIGFTVHLVLAKVLFSAKKGSHIVLDYEIK